MTGFSVLIKPHTLKQTLIQGVVDLMSGLFTCEYKSRTTHKSRASGHFGVGGRLINAAIQSLPPASLILLCTGIEGT